MEIPYYLSFLPSSTYLGRSQSKVKIKVVITYEFLCRNSTYIFVQIVLIGFVLHELLNKWLPTRALTLSWHNPEATYPFILLWTLFHVSDRVTDKGHNYHVALMLPGENIKSIHSNSISACFRQGAGVWWKLFLNL